MNMVRAGAVDHPRDWRWCGYDELVGTRQRYRLIDVPDLVRRLGIEDTSELRRLHEEAVGDLIARRTLLREALWTESLAVGSHEYVQQIKKTVWQRTSFEEEHVRQDEDSSVWVVREARDAYVADSATEVTL